MFQEGKKKKTIISALFWNPKCSPALVDEMKQQTSRAAALITSGDDRKVTSWISWWSPRLINLTDRWQRFKVQFLPLKPRALRYKSDIMILLETNQLFVERTYFNTDSMKLHVTGHLVCTCEGSRAGKTSVSQVASASRWPSRCRRLRNANGCCLQSDWNEDFFFSWMSLQKFLVWEDKAFIWQWRGWPSRHATSFESSPWPNNQVDEKCRTQKQPTFTFVVTITSRYITIFLTHWNVLQSRSGLAGHWMKNIFPIEQQICTWCVFKLIT